MKYNSFFSSNPKVVGLLLTFIFSVQGCANICNSVVAEQTDLCLLYCDALAPEQLAARSALKYCAKTVQTSSEEDFLACYQHRLNLIEQASGGGKRTSIGMSLPTVDLSRAWSFADSIINTVSTTASGAYTSTVSALRGVGHTVSGLPVTADCSAAAAPAFGVTFVLHDAYSVNPLATRLYFGPGTCRGRSVVSDTGVVLAAGNSIVIGGPKHGSWLTPQHPSWSPRVRLLLVTSDVGVPVGHAFTVDEKTFTATHVRGFVDAEGRRPLQEVVTHDLGHDTSSSAPILHEFAHSYADHCHVYTWSTGRPEHIRLELENVQGLQPPLRWATSTRVIPAGTSGSPCVAADAYYVVTASGGGHIYLTRVL